MNRLGEYIRGRRDELGLSQDELGKRAGLSSQAIGKLERGETARPGRWEKIADVLAISYPLMEEMMNEAARESGKSSKISPLDVKFRKFTHTRPDGRTSVLNMRDPRPPFDSQLEAEIAAWTQPFNPEPAGHLVGHKNLPVYAAAMGGDGHVIVTFDAIDYVKRPAILETVRDAYSVYIVGESMIPAFRPGDLSLIHPHLPPSRETDVVLFHLPPENEAECMIKRLIGISDRNWRLEQYNEFKQFDASRADWPVCHRVVGKYSAR